MSDTKYYKVLKNGRAPSQKTKWPTPNRSIPGDWFSVEGELVRCRNGLHLTSDPIMRRDSCNDSQCYLAEIEGETIGPFGDELVARKVRLVKRVPWSELEWVDPEPEVDPKPVKPIAPPRPVDPPVFVSPPKPVTSSPAMVLLSHVWKHTGDNGGTSWDRLNDAMSSSLRLAINAGLQFDLDDFKSFSRDFNSRRWIGDAEWCYSKACGSEHNDHGGNPSAVQSFEAWLGRKPFLVRHEPKEKTPKRLYVGARFRWLDNEEFRLVFVTSFNDAKKTCTAVEYQPDSNRSKIARRHTITHEKIKEYHDLLRKHEKSTQLVTQGAL